MAVVSSIFFWPGNTSSSSTVPLEVDLPLGWNDISCQDDYIPTDGCSPSRCFRSISDHFVTESEVAHLIALAEFGMSYGGGSGGPTVFDVHTGTLSYGSKFVNLHKILQSKSPAVYFPSEWIQTYRNVVWRIRNWFRDTLGLKGELYFTSPNFFSRISATPAKSLHDEYWHPHIDKKQYGTFAYTTLLYLNEQGRDFQGGNFAFLDENSNRNFTVRPRPGRALMFTSGSENMHEVRRVTGGVRYALTIAFSCDVNSGISETAFLSNVRVGEPSLKQ